MHPATPATPATPVDLLAGALGVTWEMALIPHAEQRYPTVGDWIVESGARGSKHIVIFVSRELADAKSFGPDAPYYAMLVGQHELHEALLCLRAGVSPEAVDAFDLSLPNELDPGSFPDAPYHQQHFRATIYEKSLCNDLGISWNAYDFAVTQVGGLPHPAFGVQHDPARADAS